MGIRHVNQESASTSISSDEVYKKSQISIPSRKIVDTPDAPIVDLPVDIGTNRAFNNAAITIGVTPVDTGGTATSYTAVSSPGGFTATSVSSPITIEGLTADASYTFSVRAANITGSSPVVTTTPVIATSVPDAPIIGTATGGAGSTTASITFTPGNSSGKAVTSYTAISNPDNLSSSGTSPITVSGLSYGTSYTFTVTATNDNGTSVSSAASNAVTNSAPPSFGPYFPPSFSPSPWGTFSVPPSFPPSFGWFGCWAVGTQITMADKTTKLIEDINVGDIVMSADVPTYPNGQNSALWYPASIWSTDRVDNITLTSTNVLYVKRVTEPFYYITNDQYKLSWEHWMFIGRDGVWQFMLMKDVQVGDTFVNIDNNIITIRSIQLVEKPIDVVMLTAGPNGLFYGDGILTHNIKQR
jgi:hypothetical protein